MAARLDMRGSFVSNSSARFVGAKVGLEHARRLQYGLGYSFLLTPMEHEVAEAGTLYRSTLQIGYATPYVDYAFYRRGAWEVRIPVQLGIGAGQVRWVAADGSRITKARTGLLIYEPAMTVQYRFLRYFGIGAGWGYRLVVHTREGLGERLTAPVYIFGLRFFPGDFWRDMQQRSD